MRDSNPERVSSVKKTCLRQRACGTFLAAKSEAAMLQGQTAQGKAAALPSLRADHVAASDMKLAVTFLQKLPAAHYAASPFPQKVTLAAAARL